MTKPTACKHPFPFLWHRSMAEIIAAEERAEYLASGDSWRGVKFAEWKRRRAA